MSYIRTLNTTYEEVELNQIKTHPANPRRGDLEVIKQSISTNGFYGSVVVNKRTSHILAGNHRYMAAKALGYDKVPVTWIDVGEHEEKRILAADNRTSELGSYDETILTDLLKELDEEDMLEGTGYTDDDLESLMSELELMNDEESESPVFVDDLTMKHPTQLGDVFKLKDPNGRTHTLCVMKQHPHIEWMGYLEEDSRFVCNPGAWAPLSNHANGYTLTMVVEEPLVASVMLELWEKAHGQDTFSKEVS